MAFPFSATIHLDPKDIPRVRKNGFVACEVFVPVSSVPKQLGYCLHCKRVLSLSWTLKQARRLRIAEFNFWCCFNEDKVKLYHRDILSDIELRQEKGVSPWSIPRQISATSFPECQVGQDDLLEQTDCGEETIEFDDTLQEDRNDGPSEWDGQSQPNIQVEEDCGRVLDCLLRGSF